MRATHTIPALLLLSLAGCMASAHRPDAVAFYQGGWTFTGELGTEVVSGELRFGQDQYFLQTNLSSCTGRMEPLLIQKVQARVYFACAPLSLRFNVRDGQLDEYAHATLTKKEFAGTKQTCVAWGTNPNTRQRVCTQYISEPVERTTKLEGSIKVARSEY